MKKCKFTLRNVFYTCDFRTYTCGKYTNNNNETITKVKLGG